MRRFGLGAIATEGRRDPTNRQTNFPLDELYSSIEASGVEEGAGPPLDRVSDY